MVSIYIYIFFNIINYKTLDLTTYLFKIIPPFKINESIKRLSVTSLLKIFKALIKINKCLEIAP